ncbi:MAG TPA: SDR family oxidoreductase [Opitutaceae bacterium]
MLITGGSSGIGLAIARQCAAEGAKVSLVARDAARLASAKASVAAAGASVFTASADVSDKEAILGAIRAAEAAHGPVDVLVTSAGTARPGYFEEVPLEVFERSMAVNYLGTVYALRAVFPGMRARGKGAVVLLSSGAGLIGIPGYSPYTPTKFAVRGLAETLRVELRRFGIHVLVVYPPDTDTPQLEDEAVTKPAETVAITAGGGLWSPEGVARATLAGLRERRFVVAPGFRMGALAWMHSLLAPILFSSFARTAAAARREAGLPSR